MRLHRHLLIQRPPETVFRRVADEHALQPTRRREHPAGLELRPPPEGAVAPAQATAGPGRPTKDQRHLGNLKTLEAQPAAAEDRP
jgi:hypothetical protein